MWHTLWLYLLLAPCVLAHESYVFGSVRLEHHGSQIRFITDKGARSAATSTSLKPDTVLESCSEGSELCLSWPSGDSRARLMVNKVNDDCWHYTQRDDGDSSVELSYCFEYGEDQWFGGAERYTQAWPVQTLHISKEAYVPSEDNHQAVTEPYWLSSAGVSYYVEPYVPLFIDSNSRENNSMCFLAQNDKPYNSRNESIMEFEWCFSEDPVAGHKYNLAKRLGKPSSIPDERMIRYPIYSTWARYKSNINEEVVTRFAKEILDNKFPLSQLEIDDKWEPCYGAWSFDTTKFPDIRNLTDTLHAQDIRTTLWVTPFVNVDCEPHFSQAIAEGRLVTNIDGNVETNWWNGRGAAFDFTNKTTAEWWVNRAKALQASSGIDSFKFDAGETSFLPQLPRLDGSPPELFPGYYSTKYAEAVSTFGSFIEARVGRMTQSLPVFIRMIDKDSRWDLGNGLRSLVTTMLQMNIAGYPFVLPDMIGGNVYGNDKVSKELFIRWLQANTFMPSLQFSVVPWDFDDETIEISKHYVDLHARYADQIIEAANKCVADGTPINPPIWWIAPTDPEAHKCANQYLLGEHILVAPVLTEGATVRDVYLPQGTWLDLTRGDNSTFTGPMWLRNYPAALNELPYFQKLN